MLQRRSSPMIRRPAGHRQAGLSLVELMIAVALGAFILAGLITFLVGNRQAYRIQQSSARIQEDGRFALSVLGRDLRVAGFFGCSGLTNITNNLDPAGAGFARAKPPPSPWRRRPNNLDPAGAGFAQYDFTSDGGLGGAEGGANPDSLTVRSASGQLQVQSPFGPQQSSNLKVASPNSLAAGDVVLVTDCESGDIFQITSGTPGQNGTLVHNTGAAVEPGNYNPGGCTGGNAHCLSKVYQDDAFVMRMSVIQYAVANGSNGNPALFRTGQEIVPNVSDFQVLYGEDTDGDGTANRYVDANGVTDMEEVVSLRVTLGIRGEQVGTFGAGNRIIRNFTTTVALRNRLR